MLRRRSRSTPTDDLELTAQRPVGVVVEDTSEELVLAAVDGELVHRALDRLSTRHRHVLAMREGSGWTYQQIADHEGVEIGTIETLLWRARQALKREFAVISDSKDALAGFLIATGALLRRTVFRAAHRGASVHQNGSSGGGSGAIRNAVAGVAVTGAAVAAAFIAPHALSSGPSGATSAPGSALAAPALVLGSGHQGGTDTGGSAGALALGGSPAGSGDGTVSDVAGASPGGLGSQGSAGAASGGTSPLGGELTRTSGSGAAGVAGGLNQAGSDLNNTVNGATGGVSQIVSGATGGVGQIVGGATNGVGQTAGGVAAGVTSGVSAVTNGLTQSIGLGSVLPGTSGSGSSPSEATTTTTTTRCRALSAARRRRSEGCSADRPGRRRKRGAGHGPRIDSVQRAQKDRTRNAAGPGRCVPVPAAFLIRRGLQSPAAAPQTVSTMRPLTT